MSSKSSLPEELQKQVKAKARVRRNLLVQKQHNSKFQDVLSPGEYIYLVVSVSQVGHTAPRFYSSMTMFGEGGHEEVHVQEASAALIRLDLFRCCTVSLTSFTEKTEERLRLHKVKQLPNGTYNIGRSWHLENLNRISDSEIDVCVCVCAARAT